MCSALYLLAVLLLCVAWKHVFGYLMVFPRSFNSSIAHYADLRGSVRCSVGYSIESFDISKYWHFRYIGFDISKIKDRTFRYIEISEISIRRKYWKFRYIEISKVSIYRIERVLPSIPSWHPRALYSDIYIERKLRCIKYRNRIVYFLNLSESNRTRLSFDIQHYCCSAVASITSGKPNILISSFSLCPTILFALFLWWKIVKHGTSQLTC